MTWTLDNGTVVLQNFVMAEDDCTEDRLEFWVDKYAVSAVCHAGRVAHSVSR